MVPGGEGIASAPSSLDGETRRLLAVVDGYVRKLARRYEWIGADDAEELRAAILLQAVRRLAAERVPVESLRAYVWSIARSSFGEHRCLLDPTYRRLREAVKYVVVRDPTLELWCDRGRLVCATRPCADRRARAEPTLDGDGMPPGALLTAVVPAILRRAGAPVLVSDLVDLLHEERYVQRRADPQRNPRCEDATEERLCRHADLDRLWGEIRTLPVRQRQALLLQARCDSGDSVVEALVGLGVATWCEVREVLELEVDERSPLPLADDEVAALVTARCRQHVVNLRKAARERLARRMRSRADGARPRPDRGRGRG